MVLDETTEEGRLFHIVIVLGKNNFSEHHYKQDTYLYQETLYRSGSCRRRLRKTAPCGSPGMATQVRQAYRRRYWRFSISCRSTWQLSSAPSPPVQSEFHDRDAKSVCICIFYGVGPILVFTLRERERESSHVYGELLSSSRLSMHARCCLADGST